MDHTNDSPYSPDQMMQDGFLTYEYCRLLGAYYRHQYAHVQDYQHLNDPWQQNHRRQLFQQQQQNPVNSYVPSEVLVDEEEDYLDDLASEDGIENNDAWEEDQIHDSWMHEAVEDVVSGSEIENFQDDAEYQVVWEDATILKNLKTRRYDDLGASSHPDEPEMCVVCQLEYEDNETLGILGCGHEYHAECIKRWLLQKNVCPLCKQTGVVF